MTDLQPTAKEPASRSELVVLNVVTLAAFAVGFFVWALFQIGGYWSLEYYEILKWILRIFLYGSFLIPAIAAVVLSVLAHMRRSRELAVKALVLAGIPPACSVLVRIVHGFF